MGSFVSVGTTSQTMFQCLKEFDGDFYVGCYNGHDGFPSEWDPSAIYKYSGVAFVHADYMGLYDVGESIYNFEVFDGRLYAATESTGKILRLNVAKDDWNEVHDAGDYELVLNLCTFGSYLYAYVVDLTVDVYEGKIIRTNDGTTWSNAWVAGDKFLPVLGVFDGYFYALGKHENGKAWAKRSSDGTTWSDIWALSNVTNGNWRGMHPPTWNGKMWIVQHDRGDGKAKIHSFDGTNLSAELFSLSSAPPRVEVTLFDDRMWVLFGPNGWSDADNAALYVSSSGASGTWELYESWGNVSGRCIEEFDSKLYLGLQQTLYRLDEDAVPDSPTGCAAIFDAPDESYCTWIDNSDDETGFRIEYNIDEAGWTFFENVGAGVTQSTNKQFTIGENVAWRVRAYNGIGDSAWSTSDEVYIGSGGVSGEWTTQADFEAGTLSDVWVPEGLDRLELERTALTGTATYIFDGGAGKRFNWLSFSSTKPEANIYFRDDFRDNDITVWTTVGGTWAGYEYYVKGTGNLTWGENRIRIGPDTWEGLDALFKGYYTGAPDQRFFLRCDGQDDDNTNAYVFLLDSGGNVFANRVAGGLVIESNDTGVAVPPEDAWYWFRVQIYTSGSDVVQRIKWWLLVDDEPGAWDVTYTWTGEWRSEGGFSFGRHTTAGENRYDDVLLSRQEGIPSPVNCEVTFKFWPSTDGTNWGAECSAIADVPDSRFVKIEATLARDDLLSAMPTLEDMTLGYRLAAQPQFL